MHYKFTLYHLVTGVPLNGTLLPAQYKEKVCMHSLPCICCHGNHTAQITGACLSAQRECCTTCITINLHQNE